MGITAAKIKELRELTGAGIVDVKNALVEADGNIDNARDVLREKGLAAAGLKAGRIAAEGLVDLAIASDNKKSAIVEVNSETDFVAKNKTFKDFVNGIARQALNTKSSTLDDFLAEKFIDDEKMTVNEALSDKVSIIGENLQIRRFKTISTDGLIVPYIHGEGKIAVLVELSTSEQNEQILDCAKNIALQITSMNPQFLDDSEIDDKIKEKELEIIKTQTLNEKPNLPEKAIQNIIQGRWNSFVKDFTLLNQTYVKDSKMTIDEYIKSVAKESGIDFTIKSFVRYETGEGIVKKEEDFEEEVKKAME